MAAARLPMVAGVALVATLGASAAVRPADQPTPQATRSGPMRDVRVIAAIQSQVRPAGLAPTPPPPTPTARDTVWDRLADCESGDWRNGVPVPGTARWDYGLSFSHGDHYQGGLNFAPSTWDAFRDRDLPSHAGHATREQQIEVAERVLAAQGWGAWPVCSRKLGVR